MASVLIALTLGIVSALWAINSPPGESYNLTNGVWRTNLAIGSPQAGMYIRALVARTGLFALNKSETIYFIAETDDNGKPLHSNCDYRIEGKDIDTRWWSITAYGADHYLIANEINRYSICIYDVGEKPLRITATIPDSYWSISFYQTNTDNFYVLNDRRAKSNHVDILLVGPDMPVPIAENEQVVTALTSKGVFLLRSLIAEEEKIGDLIRIQRLATCRPFGN